METNTITQRKKQQNTNIQKKQATTKHNPKND